MSEKEMIDLMEKMHRVEALMHRYQAFGMRAYGPQGNPHRGQGRVLALLKLQPEITQKDLAYLLGMRQQSVSELLAKLEQRGYITRTPSEEDRRTTIVRLTEEGRAAAEQAPRGEQGTERVFACLSGEEQAAMAGYLDRLAHALEKELAGFEADWRDAGMGPGGCQGGRHALHHGPHHGRHGGMRFGPMPGGFGPGGPWGAPGEAEE